MTALSGVRSSWLMLARNWLLLWLAAWACSCAARSCASFWRACVTSVWMPTMPPSLVRRSLIWSQRLPPTESSNGSPGLRKRRSRSATWRSISWPDAPGLLLVTLARTRSSTCQPGTSMCAIDG